MSFHERDIRNMHDDDLFPVWSYVDRLKQHGKITEFEALRWKHEIFSVMLERRLEPEGLVGIIEEPAPVL